MRLPARPTTSPTRDACRRPSATPCSTGGWHRLRSAEATRTAGARRDRGACQPPSDLPRPRRDHSREAAAAGALRGSAERVPAGRVGPPLSSVGRRAGLQPTFGQSGGPAGAADRRPRRRAPRRVVGCGLHGPAADEFLAGLPASTSSAAASICRRARPSARRRRAGPTAAVQTSAAVAARGGGGRRADRRAVRGRPPAVRRAGRTAAAGSCARPGWAALASSRASSGTIST